VNKLIREYEDQIKAYEIDLPPEIKQVLMAFVHDFESSKRKIKSPFMDLIVLDKIEDAWNSQHFFDIGAIEFLSFAKTNHPKVYDYFKDGLVTDNENTYELLGLLAASGKHAMLAIEYVHSLLNWHITEYDGKETVEYV
jgi:hypothetical protein